jgi:hypothetical protein
VLDDYGPSKGSGERGYNGTEQMGLGFNGITAALARLKSFPGARRNIVNAWNAGPIVFPDKEW